MSDATYPPDTHCETDTITVCRTEAFLTMARDSKGRNREVSPDLMDAIDPDGCHVCAFSMPHERFGIPEMRTMWLVKMIGIDDPCRVWMDCDLDTYHENAITQVVERRWVAP